jgi:RNA polymerase sigma-70 factor, ECF subfamily
MSFLSGDYGIAAGIGYNRCNIMSSKPLSNDGMLDSHEDFEGVYENNQPLIYKFIFWRTQDRMLAQDLTGSVFEKAWRTRHNFKGGSARAWLYRIARTTLIDYWRTRKEIAGDEAVSEIVDGHADLGEILDQEIRIDQLRIAVARLPREMRHVVEFRFVRGLSTRETAERLGVSEANARVIQYRALQKLRDYLR